MRSAFRGSTSSASEHARVFTVAKAMARDVLEDIRAAVDDAIANGTTLDTFKKTLRPQP